MRIVKVTFEELGESQLPQYTLMVGDCEITLTSEEAEQVLHQLAVQYLGAGDGEDRYQIDEKVLLDFFSVPYEEWRRYGR